MLLLASLLQERRQVASALAERESQYRSIFESTGDGVLITDLRTRSPRSILRSPRMTGYGADELARIHPREFSPPRRAAAVSTPTWRETETHDPVVAEVMCVGKDGRSVALRAVGEAFQLRRPGARSVGRPRRDGARTIAAAARAEGGGTDARAVDDAGDIEHRRVEPGAQTPAACRAAAAAERARMHGRDHPGGRRGNGADHSRSSRSARGATRSRRRVSQALGDQVRRAAPGSPLIIDNIWGDSAPAKAFRDAAPEALTSLSDVCAFAAAGAARGARSAIGFLLIDSDQTRPLRHARRAACMGARESGRRRHRKRHGSTTRRASLRRSRSGNAWRATFTIPSPRRCTRRRCWGGRFRGVGQRPEPGPGDAGSSERGHRIRARGDAHVAPRSPPVRRAAVRAPRPAAPAGAGVPQPSREADRARLRGLVARFPRRST